MRPAGAPLDKGLMLSTLALLVWLPLPLASNQEWSIGLFVLFTALITGLWCLSRLRAGANHTGGPGNARSKSTGLHRALQPARPLFAMLLMCQLWVCVQLLGGFSLDTGASIQYLILGSSYALLFLLIIGLFHTRTRLTLLLGVLVVSGTVQAFYGSLMTLSGIEWLLFGPKEVGHGNATGTFVNRNHLAGYLEMTLACGIGLLLALRDGRRFRWRHLLELLMGPKARLRLGLVIMVIALVMTRSRMGNTGFFASLLIVGSLFVLLNREHRLRNGLILASLILIDVLVISQYFGLEKLKDRLLSTQLEDRIVNDEVVQRENVDRDDIVGYALPMLERHALTGSGAGSFEASFQRYPGEDIRSHFDHAHNDYLQFAIEYGTIGMLPLVLFVLGALYHALQALWRRESLYRSGVGFGAAMGIIALLIHSATDFNLQIPANAATFISLCAIAVLANSHTKTP